MSTRERYGDHVLGGASTVEDRRLAAIAGVSDNWTQSVLTGTGLAAGWRCWEVGAGSGTVAEWMAEQGCAVLATDVDMRFLERLAPRADVQVARHDVVRDALPAERFDLVHARFVLEHLPERERVLDRLVEALRPGGWLVVESLARFPVEAAADADFRAAMDAVEAVLAATIGTDCAWSRALPTGLRARGLVDVGGAANVPLTGLGNASSQCWSLTLEQLAPRILELGLADEAVLTRAQERLADTAFADLGHSTLSVWARLPA